MQLRPMNKIPASKGKSQYKNVAEYIDDFMQMDADVVHVDYAPYEFRNTYSAYSSFNRIIKLGGYRVKPSVVDNQLYLIKLDR